MDLRQDKPRRVKDLVHRLNTVILEIIAPHKVHIFMERVQ